MVDHPLATSIEQDGTWLAGRDIKAGTWSIYADDTGCTWRTSTGDSGRGDGSYEAMEVAIETGESLTVLGCGTWSLDEYDY